MDKKNPKKGDKNRRRLALIMGCGIGNLRPLSKPCFRQNHYHHHILWVEKKIHSMRKNT